MDARHRYLRCNFEGDHQHISRKVLAQPLGDVGISTVTLAELLTGVAKSEQSVQNAHALESLLSLLGVAAFDRMAAMIYGAIRARLESRGTPIGPMDMPIAANAMSANAILITHNTREFGRLADLQIEDWMKVN